jgi:hypothetical protein
MKIITYSILSAIKKFEENREIASYSLADSLLEAGLLLIFYLLHAPGVGL